eukprot:1198253-Amphidinium_carterae.1
MLGMEGCKPVGTLRVEYTEQQVLDGQGALAPEEHSMFRTAVGKLLCLDLDRVDISYAVVQLSRSLSNPVELDMMHLRRCVRHLSGTLGASMRLEWSTHEGECADLCVFSDADHASNKQHIKSVSCFVVCLNGNVLCHGSRTQAVVSTSSGESEFYALTTAVSEGLHLPTILDFFQVGHRYRVVSDSTAALGIAHRQGQGKIKHLDVPSLWVQQFVRSGRVPFEKVHIDVNVADIGTNVLTAVRLRRVAVMCGMQFEMPFDRDEMAGGVITRRVWTRVDKGRRCFQTSNRLGPPWSA